MMIFGSTDVMMISWCGAMISLLKMMRTSSIGIIQEQ